MGRNRGTYLDYRTSGRRRGRRGLGIGTVCAILLVIFLAIIFGVLAYQLSKKNSEDLPGVPTSTPVPGTPTPTPLPTPTPTPTNTPSPTPTNTPTPLPTSPETGLPSTPTPVPSVWDANYLEGWTDTREKVNVIGAYVGLNLNTEAAVDKWIAMAKETELNAVVIDVKADSGRVTYQMNCETAQTAGICISQYADMPALLKKLKENGIYCIARVVCFKDNMVDNIYPEFMIHKTDGSMYKDNVGDTWINPYNRDAWEYIIDIAEQAVMDGFDEICFDYIRVATNGIIAETTEDGFIYKVDFGPEAEETSLEEIITEFTIYACNRLKPTGAYVSASVYGTIIRSSIDAARVGQNYADMSRYLDYICPMVYPSHYAKDWAGIANPNKSPYELILSEMKASVKKLEALKNEGVSYAEVRPWLQAFSYGGVTYDGEMIRKQVDATYETGYKSWFLWNAGAKYVDGCFLAEGAQTEDTTDPEAADPEEETE